MAAAGCDCCAAPSTLVVEVFALVGGVVVDGLEWTMFSRVGESLRGCDSFSKNFTNA